MAMRHADFHFYIQRYTLGFDSLWLFCPSLGVLFSTGASQHSNLLAVTREWHKFAPFLGTPFSPNKGRLKPLSFFLVGICRYFNNANANDTLRDQWDTVQKLCYFCSHMVPLHWLRSNWPNYWLISNWNSLVTSQKLSNEQQGYFPNPHDRGTSPNSSWPWQLKPKLIASLFGNQTNKVITLQHLFTSYLTVN